MRTTVAVITAVLLMFAFTACNNGNDVAEAEGFAPNQTAEAYIYIHGGYVGQAIAATDGDGNLSVELDEAFLPHDLAAVDMDSDDWTEDNTVYYVRRGSEVRVAEYIEYDGTVYVGTTVGGSVTYVEADGNGDPAGGQDLELLIIYGQDSMAAYYDNIRNGRFGVMTEFGGDVDPVTTTAYGMVTKRGSDYWDRGLGWHGNIHAMEEFIEEHGFEFNLDDMQRLDADDDGMQYWQVADAVTGATIVDFKDYFILAQAAAAQLERN